MKKKTIIILILFFSCYVKSFAQSDAFYGINYDVKKIEPTTCELNDLYLELAHQQSQEIALPMGRQYLKLIVIARPGIKDKKRGLKTLLERRLYTTRAYLTDYLEKRTKESIITAIGSNSGAEYGVIEIYILGALQHILVQNPNAGVGVGRCDSEDDAETRAKDALLYPWLYISKTKKKSKK